MTYSYTIENLYESDCSNNEKNKYELEILNQHNITSELLNVILRRNTRYKLKKSKEKNNSNTNQYEKQRDNIINNLKHRYKTDEEYRNKVKQTAYNQYHSNIEKSRENRREYYNKHSEEIKQKKLKKKHDEMEKLFHFVELDI